MTITETESAASRARRLWDGSTGSTARLLLEELLGPGHEATEILLPWISDRVRAIMRSAVREAEAETFGDDKKDRMATVYRQQTGKLPSLGSFQQMLTLPVIVPGRHYVLWRDMTVEDHRARMGSLQRAVNGTVRTIARHEWSIREIMAHEGAVCLGDIPVEELSRDLP